MSSSSFGELFDLHDCPRPPRIWKVLGERKGKKDRKKKSRPLHIWVRASTETIARRVGNGWMNTCHNGRVTAVIPYTWEEYARIFNASNGYAGE
jgi:hypothetical protein